MNKFGKVYFYKFRQIVAYTYDILSHNNRFFKSLITFRHFAKVHFCSVYRLESKKIPKRQETKLYNKYSRLEENNEVL